MHIFVTGGSGKTGPTVVAELGGATHTVTGLARSDPSTQRLQALGATVHQGLARRPEQPAPQRRRGRRRTAHGLRRRLRWPEEMMRRDTNAIDAFGRALTGSGKPLVVTPGTWYGRLAVKSTETDEPLEDGIACFRIACFRIASERACLALAEKGVRAIVVRLAPTVHGPEDHGFIPMLIATARKTRMSAYVGDGTNRWQAVHRRAAAALYRLAVEKAPAGSVLHRGRARYRLQGHRRNDRPRPGSSHRLAEPRGSVHPLREPVHHKFCLVQYYD